jgi:DNA-binding PadR family transcriptional regulator
MPRRPDARPPESFLPLPAATFQILLALVDEARHGYAIMKEVADRSDDTVRLGPGTLYGTLKRLLEAGLVEEGGGERADPGAGDERRRS